jgi:hypothetical protein
MDKPAVGKTIVFGCRFDTDNPQAAKISFPGSSIPVRILERTFHCLFGRSVIVASCAPISFGKLQNFRPSPAFFRSSRYSGHFLFSLRHGIIKQKK